MRTALVLLLLLCASLPARADDDAAKREATALMQEGNRRLRAGDNEGALEAYRAAYSRFPSAKILVNMGTALHQAGRDLEAAQTYERYLADPGVDPARAGEVRALLAELDRTLAHLDVTVEPTGAHLFVDGTPAGAGPRRVAPGVHRLRADKEGFEPAEQTVTLAPGESRPVTVRLSPVAAPPGPEPAPGPAPAPAPTVTTIAAAPPPAAPSRAGRLCFILRGDVDADFPGGSGFLGAGWHPAEHLRLLAGGVLGPSFGAYAGGTALFGDAVAPTLSLGVPVFFADGASVGVRGAGGLEWRLARGLASFVEVAVEYYPGVAADRLALQAQASVGILVTP